MGVRLLQWTVLGTCLLATGALAIAAQGNQADRALKSIGVTRGVCVLLGDKNCALARPLARKSQLVIYVQLPTADDVARACRAADAARLYGTRIFVEKGAPAHLGLASNTADAVVAVGDPAGVVKAEVLRVLRPQGKALVGQDEWIKPFPEGIDDWSHHYHGPDNNPQSRDRLARAPYLTQFVAEPRYAPAPQAAVASGGRVFMAFGHIAWHEREEPWLNTLVALDGFNGTMLWKRPLRPGIMVDRCTMIATPKELYVADNQSCKVLDPATGRMREEIVPPASVTKEKSWKWIASDGGILYALVGRDEPPDPDARWRRTAHGWPWSDMSRDYVDAKHLWGFGKTLLAIDRRTKQVVWSHQEDPPIDSRALCMAAGRIYCTSFGRYLACLDAKTGNTIWRRTAEKDPDVFQAIGPYRPEQGPIQGWKTNLYLKCTDKALYFVGPEVQWLTALSADDGHVLFRHLVKDLHLVIRDDGLYTIGPATMPDQTKKLDPLTGNVLATYITRRRSCTRATGTADSIFFRGHEGSGRLDLARGRLLWRFRAAPAERKIAFYGRLLSTWPVASGVIVDKGIAYFAAGINDFDGTHVYALDAATGAIRWQNNSCGHLDKFSSRGVACQGEMLMHDGKLYLAGGNTVSPGVFDAASGRCLNTPPTTMGASAPRGRELVLVGGQVKTVGQPLYSLPSMPVYDPAIAWDNPVVVAANARLECVHEGGPAQWTWTIRAQDPQTARTLWSHPLPGEPVRWGIAVDAQGRVIVALRSGQVLCFGS